MIFFLLRSTLEKPEDIAKISNKTAIIEGSGVINEKFNDYFNNNSIEFVEIRGTFNKIESSSFSKCVTLKEVDIKCNIRSICSFCFSFCSNLRKISLPQYLSCIGESAFESCDSLADFTFPLLTENISKGTFLGCKSIISLKIEGTVKFIGERAFSGCSSLETIIFTSNIESIGDFCFEKCEKLVSASFLSLSLSSFGRAVFAHCHSLEEVKLSASNQHFTATKSSILSKDGKKLILHFSAKNLSFVVPETVEVIESYAFFYSHISNISLSSCVTAINEYAFSCCSNLRYFEFPEGISVISDHLFAGCSSLERISFSSTIRNISASAFDECNALKELDVHHTLNISASLFHNPRSIKKITLNGEGDLLPTLEEFVSSFQIDTLVIGQGIKRVNSGIFNMKIKCLCIPNTITCISNESFKSIDVTHAIIKGNGTLMKYPVEWSRQRNISSIALEGISVVPERCFSDFTNLMAVDFDENIEEINGLAFFNCTMLRTVNVPASIKTIRGNPFCLCKSLKSFEQMDNYRFDFGTYSLCTKDMKMLISFLDFREGRVIVNKKIEVIGSCAFAFMNISYLVLPEKLTSIGNFSFIHTRIVDLFIPRNVSTIGEFAFAESKELAHVSYCGLSDFSSNVFDGCTQIKRVVVPSEYKGDVFCGLNVTSYNSSCAYEIEKNNHMWIYIVLGVIFGVIICFMLCFTVYVLTMANKLAKIRMNKQGDLENILSDQGILLNDDL